MFKWIYPSNTSEQWQQAIDHGRYSVALKNDKLRVIVLPACMKETLNTYLLKNATDPGGNLRWLQQQLLDAEKLNQYVYILIHEPMMVPIDTWNNHFNVIVERFQHIISGIFSGHTHNDEFFIGFDFADQKPFIVEYIMPSLTPLDGTNPSYRIWHGDTENFAIQDYDQYRLDLIAQNSLSPTDPLAFYKAYSFKQEYNLPSLSPQDIHSFVTSFVSNQDIATKYNINWHVYTESELKIINATCNFECGTLWYCQATYYLDKNSLIKCTKNRDIVDYIFDIFRNPWEWIYNR